MCFTLGVVRYTPALDLRTTRCRSCVTFDKALENSTTSGSGTGSRGPAVAGSGGWLPASSAKSNRTRFLHRDNACAECIVIDEMTREWIKGEMEGFSRRVRNKSSAWVGLVMLMALYMSGVPMRLKALETSRGLVRRVRKVRVCHDGEVGGEGIGETATQRAMTCSSSSSGKS